MAQILAVGGGFPSLGNIRARPSPRRAAITSRATKKAEKRMPLRTIDATIPEFEGALSTLTSANAKTFILFLADKDPSTGRSWCPDCVRAEPVIYKKLDSLLDDVVLLRAYAGDRPTWRNPAHPWRSDPRFRLTGVPTFILWENDKVCGRLEDHEAHIEQKIESLLGASSTN